jgi:hypothetical protein
MHCLAALCVNGPCLASGTEHVLLARDCLKRFSFGLPSLIWANMLETASYAGTVVVFIPARIAACSDKEVGRVNRRVKPASKRRQARWGWLRKHVVGLLVGIRHPSALRQKYPFYPLSFIAVRLCLVTLQLANCSTVWPACQ